MKHLTAPPPPPPPSQVSAQAEDTMKELYEEKTAVTKNTHATVDAVQGYFHKLIDGLGRREKALVSTIRKYGDIKLSMLDTRYNSLQENNLAIRNAVEQIESLGESDINVLKQRQTLTEEIDTHQQCLLSVVDVARKPTYLSFKRGVELPSDIGTLNECTPDPNSVFVSMRQVIVTDDEDPYLDVPLRFEDGTDHRNSVRVDDTKEVQLVAKSEPTALPQLPKSPPALKPHTFAALPCENKIASDSLYPVVPIRKNSIRPSKAPKPLPTKRSDGKVPPKVPPKVPAKPPTAARKPSDHKVKTLPASSRVILTTGSPVSKSRRQTNRVRVHQQRDWSSHSSSSDSDQEEYEPIEEIHAPVPAPRQIPPPLPPNHPSSERRGPPPTLPPKPLSEKRRKSYERSESTEDTSQRRSYKTLPLKKRSNTLPPELLSPSMLPAVGEPELLQPLVILDNNQMSFAYSHETVYPCGISYLKSSHAFVVSDVFNHCLRLITSSGKFIDKIGREGRSGGQFKEPTAIAVDSSEHIYAVERDNPRVQKFTSSGRYITKFGHKTLLGSQLSDPMGIAVADGHSESAIFVSDWEKNQVFCYNTSGKLVRVIGKTDGFLKFPVGIAVNKDGNLLVADRNSHCVWVLTSTGDLVTKIGSEGSAPGQLYYPYGVTMRDNGDVLVSESGNCRVSVFSASGSFIRCFGGRGSEAGMFNHPRHLCVSEDGLLAVVDEMNQRVQLFQL